MLDIINTELRSYLQKWNKFVNERTDSTYFHALQPTAIGWKTKDLAEFDKICLELRDVCDQIHVAWINERWLATLHLRDVSLAGDITIIKLMQRRPGSSDATGLDHVDFFHQKDAEPELTRESITWSRETNNDFCSWLSIWFDDTEAKLRTNTVLDVCISELQDTNKKLITIIKP